MKSAPSAVLARAADLQRLTPGGVPAVTRLTPVSLAIFGCVVVIVYGVTISYGFDWDDYHFVRDYSWRDVGHAWLNSWDPTGLEQPFYRPGAITFFAIRTLVVGVNAVPLHIFSLTLTIGVAVLLFAWMTSLDVDLPWATAGVVLFLVHPWFATSGPAWVTNQMHLAQLLIVLAACLIATRAPARWKTLLALQSSALLLKEDAVMLAPALALCWWTRGVQVAPRWVIGSVCIVGAWFLARTVALGGFGGYADGLSARNLFEGPLGVILRRDPLNWWFALPISLTLGIGALASPRAMRLPFGWVALWNLPLMLHTGPSRWHMLIVGVALGVAVGGAAIAAKTRSVAAVLVATSVLFAAALTPAAMAMYDPCGPSVRWRDSNVLTWPRGSVSPQHLATLAAKRCP